MVNVGKYDNIDKKRVRMNLEVTNNWPLMVVALPGEKALQNESAPPIFFQNHQRPTVLNNGTEIDPENFREKGSFINIYI
jgi:hypothetical protein